jgi:hypothetical protein
MTPTDSAMTADVSADELSGLAIWNDSHNTGIRPWHQLIARVIASHRALTADLARVEGERAQWEQNYENCETANGVWRRVAERFEAEKIAAEAKSARLEEALKDAQFALLTLTTATQITVEERQAIASTGLRTLPEAR